MVTPGSGYSTLEDQWQENARLALNTIAMRETSRVPTWMVNAMQWSHLEALSGNPPGSYPEDPVRVYREFCLQCGICFVDQWIPENPLSMRDQGFGQETRLGATTGASQVVRDGLLIDSPEAAVEHMEGFLFPQWEQAGRDLAAHAQEEVRQRIAGEVEIQQLFGPNLLKGPYGGFFRFPGFHYGQYGYENFFAAYALYPEVMERPSGSRPTLPSFTIALPPARLWKGGCLDCSVSTTIWLTRVERWSMCEAWTPCGFLTFRVRSNPCSMLTFG